MARAHVERLLSGLGLYTALSEPDIDTITKESISSSSPSLSSSPALSPATQATEEIQTLGPPSSSDSLYSLPDTLDLSDDDASRMDVYLQYVHALWPGADDPTVSALFAALAPVPHAPTIFQSNSERLSR